MGRQASEIIADLRLLVPDARGQKKTDSLWEPVSERRRVGGEDA